MAPWDWPSDLTDDEGVFVSTNILGPRLNVEGIDDLVKDPEGKIREHYPDSGFLAFTEEHREELANLEGADFLGPRYRDDQGNLSEEARDRGFVGSLTHSATSSAAGGVGGAIEGAVEGLFDDLRSSLGTIVLAVLGLIAAALLLGFSLPFDRGASS